MYVRPKFIFFENVKGFTVQFGKNRVKGETYSRYVVRCLRYLGYEVCGRMIDFSKYGIPQKRTRFILVGIRREICLTKKIEAEAFFRILERGSFEFLKSKDLPQRPTLAGAISDLYKSHGVAATQDRNRFMSGLYGRPTSKYQKYLRKGCSSGVVNSHSFPNHSNAIVSRFKNIHKIQNPHPATSHLAIKDCRFTSKHTILRLSSCLPAPTLTTLPDDYIHYSEPRILTVREYARIQSFPDWFHFKGKYTTGGERRTQEVPRYSQIGNAIPPLFGEQAGLALKELFTHA